MPVSNDDMRELSRRIKLYCAYSNKKRLDFSQSLSLEKSVIDKIFQSKPFISFENYIKIKNYLDDVDGVDASIYGASAEKDIVSLCGNYTLFAPNSEYLGDIEAFGLKIYWNQHQEAPEAEAHGVDDLKVTFTVHLPRNDGRVFLKRSYHGWGVMYVLNPTRNGIMNGVALRMDSLNADKLSWEPILFPVALKKVPQLEPYRNLNPTLEEHEEARNLIMSAVRGNLATLAVWQHWEKKMPGNPAGGPSFPAKAK